MVALDAVCELLQHGAVLHFCDAEDVGLHPVDHPGEVVELQVEARGRPAAPGLRGELLVGSARLVGHGVEEILEVPGGDEDLVRGLEGGGLGMDGCPGE